MIETLRIEAMIPTDLLDDRRDMPADQLARLLAAELLPLLTEQINSWRLEHPIEMDER